MKRRFGLLCGIAVIAAIAGFVPQTLQAEEPHIKKVTFNPDDRTIELFAGMASGELEAKIILKDSKEGKVFITNKSGQPVNVKLPDAFVAVHPQLAPGGGGGGGLNGGGGGGFGGNNGNQNGGGGFGGNGGFGGGGGLFNIPPERVGELPVVMVCLEHGKGEPNSRTKYEIKPVAEYSDNPLLPEVLSMLARGEVSQTSAQALAWHLENGMTWDELVAKKNDNLNGTFTPYFTAQDMMGAQQCYLTAKKRVEEAKTSDKSKSDSLGDALLKSGR